MPAYMAGFVPAQMSPQSVGEEAWLFSYSIYKEHYF